jgi:hypothetical protein
VDAATGIIITVAGGGTGGLGSAATAANIGIPQDVVIDSSGSLYILSNVLYGISYYPNTILKVTATAPPAIGLGTTPPNLAFETLLNGTAPAQTLAISNAGGGTLNWTATPSASWITLSAYAGTGSTNVAVTVNTVGLAPGSYSGTITVAATEASNTPQTAAVTLTVLPFVSGLVKVSGDTQAAAINSALSQPLLVRAATGTGTPAAGVQVKFELAGQPAGATGASLSATTAITESQGQAQTLLTLGDQPGTYGVRVLAAGWMQEVVFTATATATVGSLSAAASVVTASPGTVAADGSRRAVVTVIPRDASGRNLGSGQTVTLGRTGSGTLSSVTDKGDGSYTATLTAPATTGSALLSATVNSTALTATATVNFVVPVVVAGTGANFAPAREALAIDAADNVYFPTAHYGGAGSDCCGVSRLDALSGAVTSVPDLAVGFGGYVDGVAVDRWGSLYYGRFNSGDSSSGNRVRGFIYKKEALSGANATISGSGVNGVGVEEGPAALASLNGDYEAPYRLTVDRFGNLYIADYPTNRIRKIEAATSLIKTVAGIGSGPYAYGGGGYGGDGGPAAQALLNNPRHVAVDEAGNLYIADRYNHRIRKVDAVSGTITTVAGNGTEGFSGDGGPATAASLHRPGAVVVDRWGNLYIADGSDHNNPSPAGGRIRKVDAATGIIITVAGGGTGGLGSAATAANIGIPQDVVIDSSGSLYILSNVLPGTTYPNTSEGDGDGAAGDCLGAPAEYLL